MATARTIAKLDELVETGTNLTPLDLKYIFKNWEDAPRKLQSNVVATIKVLDKIAPAIQTEFIKCDPRAVKAIGELLCPAAQDLILSHSDYADDIPVALKKAVMFLHITEGIWKKLAGQVKRNEIGKIVLKKLLARKDCPPQFTKIAAGTTSAVPAPKVVRRNARPEIEDDEPAPQRRRPAEPAPKRKPQRVVDDADDFEVAEPAPRGKRTIAPVAKVVKTGLVKPKRHVEDDDFTDTRKVSNIVRKVRRPRL